jgi:hypothetical protein
MINFICNFEQKSRTEKKCSDRDGALSRSGLKGKRVRKLHEDDTGGGEKDQAEEKNDDFSNLIFRLFLKRHKGVTHL